MHATECKTMRVNAFKLAWNCQDSTLDLTVLLLAWSGTRREKDSVASHHPSQLYHFFCSSMMFPVHFFDVFNTSRSGAVNLVQKEVLATRLR